MEVNSLLQIQSVTAGYGPRVVLKDINLDFPTGFHVILGPNGAGKTTLFRTAAGMLPPICGHVEVLGEDPFKSPSVKQKIGYLSHNLGLSANLTVEDNLTFWARVHGLKGLRLNKSIERCTNVLSLSDIFKRRVRTLSRGQLQRAALAQVLLTDPQVLFLDEPTTGLDPGAARGLRNLLQDITHNKIIIYSTHNLYEAAELAQDVTFIANGEIISRGSVDELRSQKQLNRSIGIRVKGDPSSIFTELHVTAQFDGIYWLLETYSDDETGKIIESLVTSHIMVLEVKEVNNPLEELFLQLEEETKVES